MKHTYTMETDEPEDLSRIKAAMHVDDYRTFITDFAQEIRTLVKYSQVEADSRFGERLHEMFYRLLGDNNLSVEY